MSHRKAVRRLRVVTRRRRRFKSFAARLVVTYKRGFDPSLDRRIEKAVGCHRLGSGFSFFDGVRDMDFGFRTVREAKRALTAVKRELKNRVSARVVPAA
jgi:hypothetical protein